MRAVIFTNKELDLEGLELKEVYLIFAKGVRGSITVSELSETVELAQSKIPLIRRAEEIVDKLEKNYEVLGVSIIFKDYEEEIERALEAYKPDLVIAGRDMPLNSKIIEQSPAILFYREKISFEKLLYIHCTGGNIEKAKEWISKGKDLTMVGIVEPLLPPETHAKKMKESQEKIKREIEQISENLNVKKFFLVGDIVEETRRLAVESNPSILIVSKCAGVEKIEEILEKVDKNILVV